MSTPSSHLSAAPRPRIRCAIYTRVSTEEQAEGDFTSPQAQREFCEEFIKRKAPDGWEAIPTHYDDVGSGKNLKREQLRRLTQAVLDRQVQMVVAYKFDRLSRNQYECLGLLKTFEEAGAGFVATSQEIDNTSSMGFMTSSMFMSFAQLERMLISERVKDKIRATRAKGIWTGGHLPLGYDKVPKEGLVVNKKEAKQVRYMFDLYLAKKSLVQALPIVNQTYRTKVWEAKSGKPQGGKKFTKNAYITILRNRLYTGKIGYMDKDKEVVVQASHEAIISEDDFNRAGETLAANAVRRKSPTTGKRNFLLTGLIRCACCGSGMTPYFAYGRKKEVYIYYKCTKAMSMGSAECMVRKVPGKEVEALVLEHLAQVAKRPDLAKKILEEAQAKANWKLPDLKHRRKALIERIGKVTRESNNLLAVAEAQGLKTLSTVAVRITLLDGEKLAAEADLAALETEIASCTLETVKAGDLCRVLECFGPMFAKLGPREQQRLVRLVVQEVVYDGLKHTLKTTLHPPFEPQGGAKATPGKWLKQSPDPPLKASRGSKASRQYVRPDWLPEVDSNHQPSD